MLYIIFDVRYVLIEIMLTDQWRHQDLKSGGARRGATIDYGGGKHVRVAHIASAKREPIFLNCWGPIFFWANMCAERT